MIIIMKDMRADADVFRISQNVYVRSKIDRCFRKQCKFIKFLNIDNVILTSYCKRWVDVRAQLYLITNG